MRRIRGAKSAPKPLHQVEVVLEQERDDVVSQIA
jgi:hypothetical protein